MLNSDPAWKLHGTRSRKSRMFPLRLKHQHSASSHGLDMTSDAMQR